MSWLTRNIHSELSHTSSVIIFIVAVLLFVYVPMMFYLRTLPYATNMIMDGTQTAVQYPVYGGDSGFYAVLSYNLAHHGVFSGSAQAPFTPTSFTMPLYPFLLACFRLVFGSLALVPILQMLFAGTTAFLMFLLGKKLFSEKVGMLASALFILDPTVIFHTLIVMTDITYVFFLVSFFWLLFASDFKNEYAVSFFSGILFGLAMLTRTVSMFLILLVIPMYYLAKAKQMNWKKIVVNLLILIVTYSIILFPWMLRNKENFGVWALAGEGYANVFHYYVPDFLSSKENISVDVARNMLTADLALKIGTARASDIGSVANSSAVRDVAFTYIMADPVSYGEFQLIKMTPFFLSSGLKNFFVSYDDMMGSEVIPTNGGNMTDLLSHGQFSQFIHEIQVQPWVTLEEIYWVFVSILMLIGVIFSKHKLYAVSFIIIIFYFAVLTSSIAYSRFRLPALPFMLLLASAGFFICKDFFQNKIRNIQT